MFTGRKLPLTLAFALLIGLAFGASCNGFFVDPTLTSITIGPEDQNVQQGDTLQMSARGSYDDGSTKNITGDVLWNSNDENVATIDDNGLVTAVSSGVANISASLETLSDSTDVNVVLTGVTDIVIDPDRRDNVPKGTAATFQCFATVSGSSDVDITTTVTWTSDDTTNITIDSSASPARVTPGTGTATGDHTITARYVVGSTTFTDTAILNVQ